MKRLMTMKYLKDDSKVNYMTGFLEARMESKSIPERIWAEVMLAIVRSDLQHLKKRETEKKDSLNDLYDMVHLEDKYEIKNDDLMEVLKEARNVYYRLPSVSSSEEKITREHLYFPTKYIEKKLQDVTSKKKNEKKLHSR